MIIPSGKPLAFVDVETTGGSPEFDRVIEVGILRVENGKIVARYESLIDPERMIPWFITNITGIKDEDVYRVPSFGKVIGKMEELLDGAVLVAHNAAFDYGFLWHEFRRHSRELLNQKLCTVQLSRRMVKGLSSYNLDSLMRYLGISCRARHRALGDAEVVWEIYKRIEGLEYRD